MSIGKASTPERTLLGKIGAILGSILSVLFLLNLTMGVLEIPDNLPIVGNLDEVLVSAFLFGCLEYLGVNLIPFRGKLEVMKTQN